MGWFDEGWFGTNDTVANGKLVFTPYPVYAISLDGSHYLTLSSSDMNVTTGDFQLDAVILIDPASSATPTIAGKPPVSWISSPGYLFFIDKANARLGLTINDGSATALTVYSNSSVLTESEWYWVGVRLDRDGLATFYVNGSQVGTADITSRAGSLSNSQAFVCGNSLTGKIGHVRVKHGLIPDRWWLPEYYRLAYGYPRAIQDFTAFWTLPQSLEDLSGGYTLTYSGGGSPSYVDGWPSVYAPLTLNLSIMFEFPHDDGFLDFDSPSRSISGILYSHVGARKRGGRLKFPYVQPPQKIGIDSIYAAGTEFDVYFDSELPLNFQALMVGPPSVTSILHECFSVEIEIEEV